MDVPVTIQTAPFGEQQEDEESEGSEEYFDQEARVEELSTDGWLYFFVCYVCE